MTSLGVNATVHCQRTASLERWLGILDSRDKSNDLRACKACEIVGWSQISSPTYCPH